MRPATHLLWLAPTTGALQACSLVFSDYSDRFGDATIDAIDDTSSDASAFDAMDAGDGAHDADADAKRVFPPCLDAMVPSGGGVLCPDASCGGACCVVVDASVTYSCTGVCLPNASPWRCDGRQHCGGAIACCVVDQVFTIDASTCPAIVTLPTSGIYALPSCDAGTAACPLGSRPLCHDPSECPLDDGGPYVCDAVQLGAKTFGMCHNALTGW